MRKSPESLFDDYEDEEPPKRGKDPYDYDHEVCPHCYEPCTKQELEEYGSCEECEGEFP
jgi:hypothetical protein